MVINIFCSVCKITQLPVLRVLVGGGGIIPVDPKGGWLVRSYSLRFSSVADGYDIDGEE